jgi:hypothetical protein
MGDVLLFLYIVVLVGAVPVCAWMNTYCHECGTHQRRLTEYTYVCNNCGRVG